MLCFHTQFIIMDCILSNPYSSLHFILLQTSSCFIRSSESFLNRVDVKQEIEKMLQLRAYQLMKETWVRDDGSEHYKAIKVPDNAISNRHVCIPSTGFELGHKD